MSAQIVKHSLPPFWDACLVFHNQVIPLDRAVVNLGRNNGNDLIFETPLVSRRHAQIRLENGEFVLYDMRSRWGTRVNNQLVERVVLHAGDEIWLASVPLRFERQSVIE